MTLKTKFVKALEILFSNEETELSLEKGQTYEQFLGQFTDNSETQKIRELQNVVYGLSTKVTTLTDKVHELNDQIVNLTTIHEELMYALDQGFEQQEDNEASVGLNFKPKKYELN